MKVGGIDTLRGVELSQNVNECASECDWRARSINVVQLWL